MCNNCGIYLGGGKCSDNCNVIEAIQALSQDPCEDTRNMDEIAEIMKSDVNANIKCKMIDNIINSELHYFKLQQPCDAVSREEAIKVLRADTLFVLVIRCKQYLILKGCHLSQYGRRGSGNRTKPITV